MWIGPVMDSLQAASERSYNIRHGIDGHVELSLSQSPLSVASSFFRNGTWWVYIFPPQTIEYR